MTREQYLDQLVDKMAEHSIALENTSLTRAERVRLEDDLTAVTHKHASLRDIMYDLDWAKEKKKTEYEAELINKFDLITNPICFVHYYQEGVVVFDEFFFTLEEANESVKIYEYETGETAIILEN